MPGPRPALSHARSLGRMLAVVVLFVTVALLLSVESVYTGLQGLLASAEPLIAEHPMLGPVAFVGLSAVSAVLAFFSSALLVPAAVYSWGVLPTVLLLWLGWLLGGVLMYLVGHGLRPKPGHEAEASGRFAAYLPRVASEVGFPLVLLWQLALPSELPGYLCGYLGVRFRTYLAALALAELPYAMGAVLLGESVVQRELGWLLGLGVVAATAGYLVVRLLRQRLQR